MKHEIAEQEEIVLINELNALYNSIRSTTWLTISHSEFMEAQEISFVIERIKIFETKIAKLHKLNKKIISALKKGVIEFKKTFPATTIHLVPQNFREKITIPLENEMVAIHLTPEGKNWVKTSFIILRD